MNLPDWLPAEAWAAYVEMRKKVKHPLTDYAVQLAMRKLEQFRVDGEDVTAVIEQSIFHAWLGLFPVKKTGQQAKDETTPAWVQFRACIRTNTMPDSPKLRAVINDYGGLNNLGGRTSWDLDKLRADFDRMIQLKSAH